MNAVTGVATNAATNAETGAERQAPSDAPTKRQHLLVDSMYCRTVLLSR